MHEWVLVGISVSLTYGTCRTTWINYHRMFLPIPEDLFWGYKTRHILACRDGSLLQLCSIFNLTTISIQIDNSYPY